MMAPDTAEARISAPVFIACIACRPLASSEGRVRPGISVVPAASRSTACPPTMPERAGRSRNPLDDAQLPRGQIGVGAGARLARQQRKGLGEQAIAGQDGDAVAVHHVQGRPAPPQRVVVHRRQVVVNERVGVNQLDGARGRQGQRLRLLRSTPPRRRRRSAAATMASAAASARMGRSRLPPASRL